MTERQDCFGVHDLTSMEIEKRKREDEGEIAGKRPKKGAEAAAPDPEEGEVEEFFAILERIHFAVKYFRQDGGGGGLDRAAKGQPPPSSKWHPTFEKEDFEEVDSVKGPGEVVDEEGEEEEDGGLDLNAEPQPE
ncbi:protein NIM1-INTERACTING 2 [Diospyros lotus]|uniref:protein NIM1-INTERACTING 2 n=1 Tax=Diospyros lotus TaxID=55363 RepID=UPI00225AAC8F|nr:protein NIM1-INTERACTING 2 [Diospyros lotus]